ncbi:MAG TPA: hypothetical protein VFG92_05970 [Agromyces sp.]|nr:hypothetical protein [Agromyces sp.]
MSWTILGALGVISILAGIWPITGTATTWFPVLAVPAAAGLPFLIPPLRAVPLGETTWAFWGADVAGAAVMLLCAFLLLRAADERRSEPRPGRAFGRAIWVTMFAVVAGNLVRGVFSSFVVHADLGTYLGSTLANLIVSAVTGAMFGVLVGVAAAVAAAVGGSAPTRIAESARATG